MMAAGKHSQSMWPVLEQVIKQQKHQMTGLKRKELHISGRSFCLLHTLAAQPTPFLSQLRHFKRSGAATTLAEDDLHSLTKPFSAAMKDWCGQAVQVTIPAVGTGTQRAAEGGGRAEQGCAPGSRELPHWLRHFVRAVGDCWGLIHCDWVSWDVTGCWALAYIFKNWMPWKVLRFLLFCTSDLSIQRGSLCLRLTLVCKTGTVSSSLHKRE